MRVGDLVERAGATIRGPTGDKKQLEEAPYYGIIISMDPLEATTEEYQNYVRVMWFDRDGNSKTTSIVSPIDLVKISKES